MYIIGIVYISFAGFTYNVAKRTLSGIKTGPLLRYIDWRPKEEPALCSGGLQDPEFFSGGRVYTERRHHQTSVAVPVDSVLGEEEHGE